MNDLHNEITKFEKWCGDCTWPNETLAFHLSVYTQTFPGRVLRLLHTLVLEARGTPQGESYEEATKPTRSSYGFGDPSRVTAEAPGRDVDVGKQDQRCVEHVIDFNEIGDDEEEITVEVKTDAEGNILEDDAS